MKWVHGLALAAFLTACASPQSKPTGVSRMDVSFKVSKFDDEALLEVLTELNKVPRWYRKVVDDYEGKMVLAEGSLVDYVEFADNAGVFHPTAGLWDNIPGAYDKTTKQAFIIVGRQGGSGSLPLHEYGHLLDDALGTPSRDMDFRAIFSVCRIRERYGRPVMRDHARLDMDAEEFWADSFTDYHRGVESRAELLDYFPESFHYFSRLEKQVRSSEGVGR